MIHLSQGDYEGEIMTSEAKVSANQQNARQSTGPKTPQGKARSSLNAIKHGLTATSYLVAEGESAAEFERLRKQILAQFPPRNEMEKHLVERLIELVWKAKRAQRVETAALSGEYQLQSTAFGRVLVCRTSRPIPKGYRLQPAETDIFALIEKLDRYAVGIWREICRLLDRLTSNRMLETELPGKQNLGQIIDLPSERLNETE